MPKETAAPSVKPTGKLTLAPTNAPTGVPTSAPTKMVSVEVIRVPTKMPALMTTDDVPTASPNKDLPAVVGPPGSKPTPVGGGNNGGGSGGLSGGAWAGIAIGAAAVGTVLLYLFVSSKDKDDESRRGDPDLEDMNDGFNKNRTIATGAAAGGMMRSGPNSPANNSQDDTASMSHLSSTIASNTHPGDLSLSTLNNLPPALGRPDEESVLSSGESMMFLGEDDTSTLVSSPSDRQDVMHGNSTSLAAMGVASHAVTGSLRLVLFSQ